MTTPHSAPWLDHAWIDLGVTATSGSGTTERVHAYYVDAGHPEVVGDDVAWCAAFVGACLERAGLRSTRSLLARSYLTYGDAVDAVTNGAIAVFSRGSDPSQGHVAFAIGETPDAIIVLGGNQSGSVSVLAMPRARLLALRWPPGITAVPQVPASTDRDCFDRALAHVLSMEGGYSDDPYDPGGPTNLGITLTDLANYRGIAVTDATIVPLKTAVQSLTKSDVAPIYRSRYWEPCLAPQLSFALALFHFDTAVNHGLGAAAHMLQQALAVDDDGEIGPLTLGAAASCDVTAALTAYAEVRRARYRALPTFWRFGRGWLARVDATLSAASALVALSPVPSQTTIASASPAILQPTKEPPMTSTASAPATIDPSSPKWWGQSMTIWGTIVTTLATVLPIVGPVIGISISSDVVHQLGDGVVQIAQAVGGVIGIVMTIYGRARAIQPLVRRDFRVKL